MVRVNTYLTEKQKEAMDKLVEETGLPFSELLRQAIQDYLIDKGKI